MRTKNVIILIVTCFMIAIPFLPLFRIERPTFEPIIPESSFEYHFSQKTVPSIVKASSEYTEHDPIVILSNEEFISTATAEGWPGDGTESSPIIIDGFAITGADIPDFPELGVHCVMIDNTDLHFQLSNCFLDIKGTGLRLWNVKNAYIFNNTLVNNENINFERWGITAAGEIYSGDNIFANNTISRTQFPFDLNQRESIIANNTIFGGVNGIWVNGNDNVVANNSVRDAKGGPGIGISNAMNTTVSNNFLYRNMRGIRVSNSAGCLITANRISENGYCIDLEANSNNNLVAANLFRLNIEGGQSQALDNGKNNVFTKNYWDGWTGPDVDGDGYVDIGYMIDGEADNEDSYPLTSTDQLQSQHFLSIPAIINPTTEIYLEGTVLIQWYPSSDSFNHSIISYDLSYSLDEGTTWNLIASNLTETHYTWNASSLPLRSKVWLKVSAICTEGETIAFISRLPYLTSRVVSPNPLLPLLLLLVSLITVVSGGVVMWRYRTQISETIVSYIYGTGALANLKRGTAVNMDILAAELECSQLELPRTIKEALAQQMDSHSLVMRSGLLLIEKTPPPNARGQICGTELIGDTYFQCENCQRYVCTPHYVDLKIVGKTKCPNCSSVLISLPFTCPACQLDYTDTADFAKQADRCSLCSYSLPSQDKLIEERTHTIIPSVKPIQEEDFEVGKKGTSNKK